MVQVISEHHRQGFFSEYEYNLISALIEYGQEHLFDYWDPIGTNDGEKRGFLKILSDIDGSYPDGIVGYIKKAKKLLDDSLKEANPFRGFIPRQPDVVDLSAIDALYRRMENKGLRHANEIAVVMVAGGLGERLGYNGIKVDIPIQVATNTTYLQLYAQSIIALEERVKGKSKKRVTIPFIIMTSDDTHKKTIASLHDNNYYGLKRDQVILLKQHLVPAIRDNSARIALQRPYSMVMKPHGHGDIHWLMYSNKVLQKLIKLGKKYIVFIQDTNGQVFNAVLPCLGVSIQKKFDFNFLAVPRVPKESVGAIVTLTGAGKNITINIEYNQLDSLLRETVNVNGDVPDKKGLSIFPGNTNVLIINTQCYNAVLNRTKGIVPEFINPKYTDETRTGFKEPSRIETLMQDITRLFTGPQSVGTTVLDRAWCFSANKNNIIAAKDKAKKNLPPESAATAESDYYLINRKKLSAGRMRFEKGGIEHYHGVPFAREARVILYPGFSLTLDDARKKIKGGFLSKDSTLVLQGEEIYLDNLVMKGNSGLIISVCRNAALEIKNLTVNNDGFRLVKLTNKDMTDPGIPEYIKIRGYKIIRKKPLVIDITEPGRYRVGKSGTITQIPRKKRQH